MVDISESSCAHLAERFRDRGGEKGERALAIKQSWLQVFDVLDINLDHASLNYSPDSSPNKEHPIQPSINVNFLRNELFMSDKNDDVLANQTSVGIDGANSESVDFDLRADLVSIGAATGKGSLEHVITPLQPTGFLPSYDIKLIIDRSLIGDKAFSASDISQVKKPSQLVLGNVSAKYRQDVAVNESNDKAASKSSSSTTVAIKQDSEIAQPSQISLTKVDGGYLILARDYRASEKFYTRKLVESLKSILLAGGALKKILMNGKTIP